MLDTYVTIIGLAMNAPEVRTTAANVKVATFRISGHPRHFDQKSGRWADSPGLRIRVNCWRRLADNVATSVKSGEPLIVYGRISTRDWVSEDGENRTNFEVEAVTVGHDLNRGTDSFIKASPEVFGRVADDAEADMRVNGEVTYPLSESVSPEPDGDDADLGVEREAMELLRAAGFGSEPGAEGEDQTDEEGSGSADGSGGSDGRSRRRGRQPVPA
jgi:single-strand DNA-binding protein